MRGENGIRPGSSLPPALRATSLAEAGSLAPSARGLRPQAVGERTFRSHNVKRESHYALL